VGDRWIITVACPKCGFIDNDVYFAPTCDFVDWKCPECGHVVDLVAQTGVTYEDASNAGPLAELCSALARAHKLCVQSARSQRDGIMGDVADWSAQ